jgi:hypothetical protein
VRALCRAALVVSATLLGGCEDGEQRMKQRQEALDQARAAQKEKEAQAKAPPAAEQRPAHPYWDDPSLVAIRHEQKCPEGLWALFPGRAPGGDDATRKENEGRRAELAKSLREKTFVARLRGPPEVDLKDFDAPKGHFPLEVLGLVDCEDSVGRIAFSFTQPKAIDPKASSLEEGNTLVQSIWTAPPQTFTVPMPNLSDAKTFTQKHRFGMEGYVVFKLGKTEVHKKLVKVKKATHGEVSIGGTTDDFGAGRLVRGEVQGVRVLAHPGPLVVVDTREPSSVSLR